MFLRKNVEPSEWLIIGLGNPGSQYRGTRHNVGFELIDLLAETEGKKLKKSKHYSIYECLQIGGVPVTIAKPLTFMNLSGNSVKPWLKELNLKPDRLLVIADDLHLPVGKLRLREKGSSGGHNGHKSIIERLGTDSYLRLKIGIGSGDENDTIDHVLGKFTPTEQVLIREALVTGAQAIRSLLADGHQSALHVIDRRL